MDQEKTALELKIWKELAASKALLMKTAIEMLGLSADCSSEVFQKALHQCIRQGSNSQKHIDSELKEIRTNKAQLEQRLKRLQGNLEGLQLAVETANTQKESLEKQAELARDAHGKEVKKLIAALDQKQREVKSINTALSDTPENINKKIKKLIKEKHDISLLQKRIEAEVRTLRKTNKQLEAQAALDKQRLEKSEKLAEDYKHLHTVCLQQHTHLQQVAKDPEQLETPPDISVHLEAETTDKESTESKKKAGTKTKSAG